MREKAVSEESRQKLQQNPYLEIWEIDYYSSSDEEDNDSDREKENSEEETESESEEEKSDSRDSEPSHNFTYQDVIKMTEEEQMAALL